MEIIKQRSNPFTWSLTVYHVIEMENKSERERGKITPRMNLPLKPPPHQFSSIKPPVPPTHHPLGLYRVDIYKYIYMHMRTEPSLRLPSLRLPPGPPF